MRIFYSIFLCLLLILSLLHVIRSATDANAGGKFSSVYEPTPTSSATILPTTTISPATMVTGTVNVRQGVGSNHIVDEVILENLGQSASLPVVVIITHSYYGDIYAVQVDEQDDWQCSKLGYYDLDLRCYQEIGSIAPSASTVISLALDIYELAPICPAVECQFEDEPRIWTEPVRHPQAVLIETDSTDLALPVTGQAYMEYTGCPICLTPRHTYLPFFGE